MTKIIFIDIDGPLIPQRAYALANQTKPYVMTFDPCAVGLLNELGKEHKWEFVIHSSWLRAYGEEPTLEHCISEGLAHFHKDATCDKTLHWRYDRVAQWLREHEDVTDYVIIDDEEYTHRSVDFVHPPNMAKHLLLLDFDEGFLMKSFRQIKDGNWKI